MRPDRITTLQADPAPQPTYPFAPGVIQRSEQPLACLHDEDGPLFPLSLAETLALTLGLLALALLLGLLAGYLAGRCL